VEVRIADAEPAAPVIEAPPEVVRMPPMPRSRRGRAAPSLGVTLAVLFLGLAGGGALVRLRPDLFGVGHAPAAPPAATPTPPKSPAAEPPAITAEPRGAQAPGWTPSTGARAERAPSERAR
jgi:hypothetical protein